MYSHSYLFGGNAPFIEDLYEKYLADPNAIDSEWRAYFDKLSLTPGASERDVPHLPIQESFIQLAKRPHSTQGKSAVAEWESMQKQVGVLKLITAYRVLGARQANLDPLKRMDQAQVPELDLNQHGLSDADMAVQFNVGSLVGPQRLPLSEILARLKQTYCGNIGLEYMPAISLTQPPTQRRFQSIRPVLLPLIVRNTAPICLI